MRVFTGFCIGFVSACWFLLIIATFTWTPNWQWRNSAIERGYGLYCPNNGNFAWIGECE